MYLENRDTNLGYKQKPLLELSDRLIKQAEIIENEIMGILDNNLDEEDFDILMNGIMDHTLPEVIAAFFAAKYYLDDEEKDRIIDALKSQTTSLVEFKVKKNNGEFFNEVNVLLLKNIFLTRKYNSKGQNDSEDNLKDNSDDD